MRIFQGTLVLIVLAMAGPVSGATWTVSDTTDNQSDANSLRWAVTNANSGDTINFSFACPGTTSITVNSALDIKRNLTITGPGAACLSILGTNQSRVFTIESGVTASISGVTIANGRDVILGGGVSNLGTLSLSDCVVTGNFVPYNMGNAVGGGGIANAGTLTITNCSISNNSTDATGGAIRNANAGTLNIINSTISNNSSQDNGGGIWTKGILHVSGSTFSGNSAAYNVSTSLSPEGGAIYVQPGGGGGGNVGGSGTIVNSTFSANAAKVYGGAISNHGTLSVSASTFSGNQIQNGGGGGINTSDANGGSLTLKSNILADSTPSNCLVTGSGLVSMGFNLSTDNTCAALNQATDQNGAAAGLDPSGLQNNGGSTQTIALLSTSAAVNAGSCTDVAGNTVSTDQRGVARPQGSTCDKGAFELEASANTVINTNDSGSGSLRDVIANAQDGSTIDFNLTLPATIALTSGGLTISKNLTIRGPGAGSLSISGNNGAQSCFIQNGNLFCIPPSPGSQIFYIVSGATVSITGVTLENGNNANGGAVVNYGTLNLGDCTITGNQSAQGAALNNQSTGTLVVNRCTVSGNTASGIGGGLFNAGNATITASTFSGNNASEASGAFNNGTLVIANSSFAGNQASAAVGGVENLMTLHLSNTTFFNNSSPSGGALFQNQGTSTVKGTLLAKSAGGNNCVYFAGSITSLGYNLSDDSSCGAYLMNSGDQNNVASGLDPSGLQDNGGPTKTIALVEGSGAIDVIPPASCTDVDGHTLATDQRGIARPQGINCDSGAYEAVRAATTTTLSSLPNPSTYGASVTFTATVAPQSGSGSPTGTVAFFDGANSLGTVTLSSGQATLKTSALTGGAHTITATYNGGGNFAGSSSAPLSQSVNQASTSTTLGTSLNPSTYGQQVSLTAAVLSTAGTPTGSVTFSDGVVQLGTVSLSSGQAVLAISTLAGGAHTITATYNGDPNFSSSTSSGLSQTVNKATPTVTVVSWVNPSTYGQQVSFTATVSSPAGTPTGSVSFFDATTLRGIEGALSLTSGQATLMISNLPAGPHTIVANYGGDTNFASRISANLAQLINQATTTASLTASPNPATTAQSVNLVAGIVAPYGGLVTGTVTFKEGANKVLGTAAVAVTSSAGLSVSLGQGSHTITALYSGDSNATGSTSPAVTVVIAAPQATTTSISSSLNPSYVGQLVTFTAMVMPPSATGTVTFAQGQNIIGTASLSSGQASLTTANLSAGNLSIVAVYSGDSQFAGSTSPSLSQSVLKGSTATTITAFPNPSRAFEKVSFVAHVTVPPPNSGAPIGLITFMIGNTSIGSAPLDQTGTAAFQIMLPAGRYNVKAVYAGSAAFLGSASSAITEVVN